MTAVAPFQQPEYKTRVFIQGIMTRDLPGHIRETTEMLKLADQAIDNVEILSHNGYGQPMSADIVHHPAFPVNEAVLKNAQRQVVNCSPWSSSSCAVINNTVSMLKSCDMKIINVDNIANNGYGKILQAQVCFIPSAKYTALMAAPPAETATKP
ncbi:MAG TPA: hypothetical protein VGO93_19740 [Candidatus Xenobia bacterium]|jgi:hypothetical protein